MTSRAELLEQCKAAGLKASGWKKERMLEELENIEHRNRVSMQPQDAAVLIAQAGKQARPGPAPEPRNAAGDPEAEPVRRSLSGWCQGAPSWGRAHLTCQGRLELGLLPMGCGCTCHEPGWTRPPIPEGAQLSKYNLEDRLALGLDAPDAPDPEGRLRELAERAAGLAGDAV